MIILAGVELLHAANVEENTLKNLVRVTVAMHHKVREAEVVMQRNEGTRHLGKANLQDKTS